MAMRLYVLFSILMICNVGGPVAQSADLRFENISAQLGAMYVQVNQILEDELGFLWFATNEGLFRYDGYELVAYRHDVNDPESLSSPKAHYIAEDNQGQIWVTTIYGLNMLDRRTGKFQRYLPVPEASTYVKHENILGNLLIDDQGYIWTVGQHNLYRFDPQEKTFRFIRQADDSTKMHAVTSIIATTDGTLWCGTQRGLLRASPGDTTFTHIIPERNGQAFTSRIAALATSPDNKLYLRTSRDIVLYNPKTNVMGNDLFLADLRGNAVESMTIRENGDAWIAFQSAGAALLQRDGNVRIFKHDDVNVNSIPNNAVRTICVDQTGNIWFGTTIGVSKVTTTSSGFDFIQNVPGNHQQSNSIYNFCRDNSGTLWTNTEDGIYVRDANESIAQRLNIFPGIRTKLIGDWIYQDASQSILIPVDGNGIWIKKPSHARFTKMKVDPILEKTHVYKITRDNEDPNVLWIGAVHGLCRLNTKTSQSEWFQPRNDVEDLTTNRVTIYDQIGDEIWLYYTFFNKLGRFDKTNGTFEIVTPLSGPQNALEGIIRDIAISSDRNIWFATNFGLTRFSISDQSIQIYAKSDGLDESDLNSVIVDQNDQVWVSGHQFIARLNVERTAFTNYRGVKEVGAFKTKSKHLDEDGRIYFGGINGIYTFHPDSIKTDLQAPAVVLTDFRVSDSTYLLDTAVEYTSIISLAHDQNDIAFAFAGIHYVEPELIQYQCILEGYDDHWRELGNQRHVNYTNLNPGNYTFRARAANHDGIWSHDGLNITLKITPPFTQTNWFRALIALALGLVGFTILKLWQYQQKLRREKDIAEQAADYRMKFLSHISHEIRTPMNAIVGLSNLAKETKLDAQQHKYISTIAHSSENLLTIVNELLDHSKLDSGKFTFTNKPFSLNSIIKNLEVIFSAMASNKGLSFELSSGDNIPDQLSGDAIRLEQILTNLLGNAVKYTSTGTVSLHITRSANKTAKTLPTHDESLLSFEITDTGAGISEQRLESIFDRFSNSQAGTTSKGTGLGLYITRQLVDQQGGKIKIDSKLNEGTKVHVTMPFEMAKGTEDSQLQHTQQPPSPQQFDFNELRILVVDDAPFNHMVVIEMLKKRIPHAQVTTAIDGQTALDLLEENTFDLIIMDAKMPGMDGHVATRKIRATADATLRNIPILGATAGAMPKQIKECLDSGMDDVITKPIKIDLLVEKLFDLTQKSAEPKSAHTK